MKPKRKISNRVLQAELSWAMKMMDDHNFGYAKEAIRQTLKRVKEYDMKEVKP